MLVKDVFADKLLMWGGGGRNAGTGAGFHRFHGAEASSALVECPSTHDPKPLTLPVIVTGKSAGRLLNLDAPSVGFCNRLADRLDGMGFGPRVHSAWALVAREPQELPFKKKQEGSSRSLSQS